MINNKKRTEEKKGRNMGGRGEKLYTCLGHQGINKTALGQTARHDLGSPRFATSEPRSALRLSLSKWQRRQKLPLASNQETFARARRFRTKRMETWQ